MIPRDLRSDVAPARADRKPPILHFHADGVPATVLLSRARVAQIVLLAQFIGDPWGGAIEGARAAADLGSPAGAVGGLARPSATAAPVAGPRPAPAGATVRRRHPPL